MVLNYLLFRKSYLSSKCQLNLPKLLYLIAKSFVCKNVRYYCKSTTPSQNESWKCTWTDRLYFVQCYFLRCLIISFFLRIKQKFIFCLFLCFCLFQFNCCHFTFLFLSSVKLNLDPILALFTLNKYWSKNYHHIWWRLSYVWSGFICIYLFCFWIIIQSKFVLCVEIHSTRSSQNLRRNIKSIKNV